MSLAASIDNMSKKRALESFFTTSSQKKARPTPTDPQPIEPASDDPLITHQPRSTHPSYPFSVPHLPPHLEDALSEIPASEGREINDQTDLDLLYFQPFIPSSIEKDLFEFLRKELFFYRVKYNIKRGGMETKINTPRYTTVFGVDATSKFSPTAPSILVDANTSKPIPRDRYTCTPRPIPQCLDALRAITEVFTNATYNFCLVNYYANGGDSISYHSDDERFLGPLPSIASFSLGARRDFLMKHKPIPPGQYVKAVPEKPLKLPLASGDMVLMRGTTQANWLHSIPKRSGKGKGGEGVEGRINITFRKAMVRGGTENYYRYNVGEGGVWKWDKQKKEMTEWKSRKDDQRAEKEA